MKKIILLSFIVALSFCFFKADNVEASDYCKYHYYKAKDSSNGSFDSYLGTDYLYPDGTTVYATTYSARQKTFYRANFRMKGGGTWLGSKKNNGAQSYVRVVGGRGYHMHCTSRG